MELILLPHLYPLQTPLLGDIRISDIKYVLILMRPHVQLWRHTTAIVNWPDRHLTTGVVNCC